MADTRTSPKQSWWIRFVTFFLLWVGGRSVLNLVFYSLDPEFQAASSGFGPLFVVSESLSAFLCIGAGVAIATRFKHALMMATAALALMTGLGMSALFDATSDLPALRAAYQASREARGTPVPDDRLDLMFAPEMIPYVWGIGFLVCVTPYAILLWKKRELEPVDEDAAPGYDSAAE
jgi:hypothetical protein